MRVIRGRDFWLGAFAGAILTVLAMEPATTALRSLFAPDARLDAVKRANASLKNLADAQAAEAQGCRGKLADLEFKVEAQSSSGRKSTDACVQELTTIKGLSIKEREAIRVAGGRLYVGAEDAWTQGSPAGCRLNVSTDLEAGKTPVRLAVGESIEIATGIGPFRIILAGVPDGLTCVVDIMRPR
jgi:hypothetical protein